VSNKSLRTIASFLAIPLALGAIAIVRARATGDAAARSGAVDANTGGSALSSPTSSGGLSHLFTVTPDGTAAGLQTYSASGTVSSTSSSWVNKYFPKQARATQTSSDPASSYWALLIGINDYSGSTPSNVGSKQDAESLGQYLVKLGWRSDHIFLLRDLNATASHIIDSMRWLAAKTTSSSTVVFHYAGHENWRHSSSERDGRDIGIWAADNRMIYEKTVGVELGKVRAAHMWIDMATCRAAGFDEPGMVKAGRVLTYSSKKNEFSYEDPSLHHSVFGWYMIVQAMAGRHGDANHDRKVTVEEAFAYSKNRTAGHTSGNQHPVIVDKAGGKMSLVPPKPSPKPASSSSSGSPTPSTPPKTCIVLCF
jgi:hypothetical protein